MNAHTTSNVSLTAVLSQERKEAKKEEEEAAQVDKTEEVQVKLSVCLKDIATWVEENILE